jgi:hypothetical protein
MNLRKNLVVEQSSVPVQIMLGTEPNRELANILPFTETFAQLLNPTVCLLVEAGKTLRKNDFAKAWQRASSPAAAGKITQKIGNIPLIHFKQFSLKGSIFR